MWCTKLVSTKVVDAHTHHVKLMNKMSCVLMHQGLKGVQTKGDQPKLRWSNLIEKLQL